MPFDDLEMRIDGMATASEALGMVFTGMVTAEIREGTDDLCDVFWGSHGCRFHRGHEGQCECDCGFGPPYYGPDTHFYGDDVRERGLPHIADR